MDTKDIVGTLNASLNFGSSLGDLAASSLSQSHIVPLLQESQPFSNACLPITNCASSLNPSILEGTDPCSPQNCGKPAPIETPILEDCNYPEVVLPSPVEPPAPTEPYQLVTISNLTFSGNEGDSGTFQFTLNLKEAPTSDITLAFTSENFLVVDADGTIQNGTQSFITLTPQTWNQSQTVWFIAEVDGVNSDRTIGNTIDYQLSGGINATGTYDLGAIVNTYSPDPLRFNIDLDFRNDASGFWIDERRAIAQQAALTWSQRIASEWTDFQINGSVSKLENGFYANQTFQTQRHVDDLVVFVNTMNSGGLAGGYGGVDYNYGGWITSADLMPRVGQIVIDEAVTNTYLYNAVLHELGHTLGLLGLNWEGYLKQDFSTPETAVFKGEYSTALNGGQYIPLQSQDGASPVTGAYDYWHPAARIPSIMSYGWIYDLPTLTEMDFAMLADSGYRVYGFNEPFPVEAPAIAVPPPSVETAPIV
jgi:hypothetical protein